VQIIAIAASLGSLICWIMTLVQMFQKDSVLKGILGIICGLWAFVWGWMKAEETGQKNVMIIWSVCILIGIVANLMGGAAYGV
jgi:hypothetical protein